MGDTRKNKYALWLFAGIIILSTLFAYFFSDIFSDYIFHCTPDYPDTTLSVEQSNLYGRIMAVTIIFFALGCVIPIGLIIGLVLEIFTKEYERKKKLILVLATYFYMILGFANTYFLMSYFGDSLDAYNKFFSYYSVSKYWSEQTKEYMIQHDVRVADSYAFQGISKRLWSGIDSREIANNLKPHYIKEVTELVPVSYIFENVEKATQRQTIYYLPDNKRAVYTDCLYLSVVTISSLGYGDIIPKWPLTKLLISLEVIMGQLLLALGIASAFSEISLPNQIKTQTRKGK